MTIDNYNPNKKYSIVGVFLYCFIIVIIYSLLINKAIKILPINQYKAESAVSIFIDYPNGHGFCSGVLLDEKNEKSYVLTAKHCVSDEGDIYVESNIISNYYVSTEDDLALLVINGKIEGKNKTLVSSKNPKLFSNIYHIGFPNIKSLFLRGNIVIKTEDCYYAFLDVIHGCSGGGIWNTNNELVGILWGGSELANKNILAIFEPIEDVNIFLNEINYNNLN